MKSLFFVSVAICILSGTSLSAAAQHLPGYQDETGASASITSFPGTLDYRVLPVESTPQKLNKFAAVKSMATELCSKAQFKFAQLLDRNVEMLSNVVLFSFIDDWWHTRYRFGGTTKKGIDCSAFTGLLLKDVFNIIIPRTARMQYAASDKVSKEDMVEGDLVFFNTIGGVSHVGFYLGGGYFVHSSSSQGVTIDNLDEGYYSKRFIGGGRPHNETEEISVANAG